MVIDTTTELGARAARRLDEETIIWLTTVRADGMPQPSPVWFVRDGMDVLIYSRPNTPKLRNIAINPRVALHFDGDGDGGDIVILSGTAREDPDAPRLDTIPEYTAKYAQRIVGMGLQPDTFAMAYSVAIRVTPEKLRGF